MMLITSPVDLWRNLCAGAGLELRLKGGRPGRDADIEESLRLALKVPDTAASLEEWLALDAAAPLPIVSIEQLLIEVLKSQGGFAQMMQDILDVLITAQAQQSSHPLSVEFKFDDVTDPIKATLEQFRKAVDRMQRVLEKRPKLPNNNLMWLIWRELHDLAPKGPADWPEEFPPAVTVPTTGHGGLDVQLARLTRLVSDFIQLWKRYGATRKEVMDAAHTMTNDVPDAQILRGQLSAASDYWGYKVLSAAQDISRQILARQLDPEMVLEKLAKVLSGIEWIEVWVEHTTQELLDVLRLPVWKRRHELYSVWVGTKLLRVAERAAPNMRFHPVDGVLSFEFGGSRLATFNWNGTQFDIWAELRSALVGRSSKRKKGIQPDFRVLRPNLSNSINEQTTYVLECKHYLSASTSNFTQAATDYARSCPNAVVHVVNHGPTDESALRDVLPAELQPRARFIGSATPLQETADQALSRAIQDALFPGQMLPASDSSTPDPVVGKTAPTIVPGCVGYVLLEWDESLDDMDLALKVIGSDGRATQSIDFRNEGALHVPPFACFVEDIRRGPGIERIDISAWHFSRYELVATNFSKSGRMVPQALHCNIVTEMGLTQLHCPAGLAATSHEWRIAELHVSSGMVTIVPCH
ncbi:hypothetical protein [Chromobacterium violaceum]|uniref:hypothetical protein n=1 Tax=Chromobacterium violaceum TaxID=536 RepID=UPI0005B7FE21|nr:hypothetical protein [Chromobacterium violaceum]